MSTTTNTTPAELARLFERFAAGQESGLSAEEFACLAAGIPAGNDTQRSDLYWETAAGERVFSWALENGQVLRNAGIAVRPQEETDDEDDDDEDRVPTTSSCFAVPDEYTAMVAAVAVAEKWSYLDREDEKNPIPSELYGLGDRSDPSKDPLYRGAVAGDLLCAAVADRALSAQLLHQHKIRRRNLTAVVNLITWLNANQVPYTAKRANRNVRSPLDLTVDVTPIAAWDADQQLVAYLIVAPLLDAEQIRAGFAEALDRYAPQAPTVFQKTPLSLLVNLSAGLPEPGELQQRLDETKQYLADPFTWALTGSNRDIRRRRTLNLSNEITGEILETRGKPLVGLDTVPDGADDLTKAAWVWANYTYPAEQLSAVMRDLPQPLRICLIRSQGARQVALIRVLNQESSDS